MTKLLERFDALCEQLRSLPDPAERERTLATFVKEEAYALDEAEALDIGAAIDAMTDDELRELMPEPGPKPLRWCRLTRGSAETLEKLREIRFHRRWNWNQGRRRVGAIDQLKRELRAEGATISRPRYMRPAERRNREWC
jgi:hypothetical protein